MTCSTIVKIKDRKYNVNCKYDKLFSHNEMYILRYNKLLKCTKIKF